MKRLRIYKSLQGFEHMMIGAPAQKPNIFCIESLYPAGREHVQLPQENRLCPEGDFLFHGHCPATRRGRLCAATVEQGSSPIFIPIAGFSKRSGQSS